MDASQSCIFCRIARREIPAALVHEEDELLAFHDLNPQAPVHILLIPRRHIPSVGELQAEDREVAGRLLLAAAVVARGQGLDATGFRVVANVGEDGGQTVGHLHLHLLGGRRLTWPPG